MPSFNKIMQLWHAYKRVDKRREHLGYYASSEDAQESERLGKKTDKCVCTSTRRAEKKATNVVENLLKRAGQKSLE